MHEDVDKPNQMKTFSLLLSSLC